MSSVTSSLQSESSNNLTAEDLAAFDKLRISGGLLALARVERVLDVDARERFGIKFDGDLAGIVFPYYLNGARVTARLRRDCPEIDEEGEVKNKYVSAFGDHRHLYCPPDYQTLLDDPTIPLIFVEAEKSVLSIIEWSRRTGCKVLPLACGGCWGWRGRTGIKITVDGGREEDRGPLPEIAWAANGRVAVIVFDANVSTNVKVQQAREALRGQLTEQGAAVLVRNLPVMNDVNGVDDFIGVAGDKAFLDLLNQKAAAGAINLLEQSLSDHGNAQRLIAFAGQNLRYCTPMDKWLLWDGRRWKIDTLDEIRKLTQNMFVEFVMQAMAAKSKVLLGFAGHCLNSRLISAAIREAQPLLAVAPDALDTDPWLLNFLNGTLNLRGFELLQHSREYLITKLVAHDYNPKAEAPQFTAFLDRLLGSLTCYVQKALGYSVTGMSNEKCVFLCLGKTNSGKTTLLSLIRDLFNEYATLIMIDSLMRKSDDNNSRADLADLRGVRFAATSETEEGQRLRESNLKRIVQGQGRIKSVRKYEHPIEFPETHKLWIDANHLPVVHGSDDAIWSRLVPIPFDRPLEESEIDRELPAKLRLEAEGIIAWILEGTSLWQRDGLGKPPQIEAARGSWREAMDRLAAFRQACCIEAPEMSIQARPLYVAYRKWSEEAGEKPLTETAFALRMADGGFK